MNSSPPTRKRDFIKNSFRKWWSTFPEIAAETIAMVFSIILTGFLTYTQWEKVNKQLEVAYQKDKVAFEQELKGRLQKYETLLIQTANWVVAMGPKLSKESYKTMAQDLELSTRFPAIAGMGYIKKIRVGDIDRFETEMTLEHGVPVKVTPRESYGGYTYPIAYLEPEDLRTNFAYGAVIMKGAKPRAAMELARDTAHVVATDPVSLLKKVYGDEKGFLLITPVFSKPVSELRSISDRQANLVGYVSLVVKGRDLFDTLADAVGLRKNVTQVSLFIGNETDSALLYTSNTSPTSKEFISGRELDLGYRKWKVSFWKTTEGFFSETYKTVWFTLAVGSLISALICALVWSLKQRLLSQRQIVSLQRSQQEKLERAVDEKTRELTEVNRQLLTANKELEAFTYSVSHDLRAPLRGVDGFCHILVEDYKNKIDSEGQKYLDFIREGVQRMGTLIDDMLNLSRIGRAQFLPQGLDVSRLCREICDYIQRENPTGNVEFVIAPDMHAVGDLGLVRILFENLIMNALKFSKSREKIKIEMGYKTGESGENVFFVKDNGIGFDMRFATKIFDPFKRLHSEKEFPGSGIGLATCKRVVQRHGGKIWAEASLDGGATFYFTLITKIDSAQANNHSEVRPDS